MTPVVAAAAARVLHDDAVTASIVRKWASAGWLVAVGVAPSSGGRPAKVYDVDDLWSAYDRWKES